MTTAIVSAPCSLAISATIGAAPEPVPPPRPEVMKTMSEPSRAWAIFSLSSSAARSPIEGSPPAPRPRVSLSPMRSLCGASDWRRAWASVFRAMNSTPIISARIIRLTALLPPPPTPTTLTRAKFSESERRPIDILRPASRGRVMGAETNWAPARSLAAFSRPQVPTESTIGPPRSAHRNRQTGS